MFVGCITLHAGETSRRGERNIYMCVWFSYVFPCFGDSSADLSNTVLQTFWWKCLKWTKTPWWVRWTQIFYQPKDLEISPQVRKLCYLSQKSLVFVDFVGLTYRYPHQGSNHRGQCSTAQHFESWWLPPAGWATGRWRLPGGNRNGGSYKITTKTLHIDICL